MIWTVISGLFILFVYKFRNTILLLCHLHPLNTVLAQFPTTPYHWFLGHFVHFPGFNDAGLAYYRSLVTQYPRCIASWNTCLSGHLGVRHPSLLKEVLKRSDPKPTHHGEYSMFRDWLGDGLIMSNGPKWYRNRRLLTHAFHFDILKPYISVFNKVADTLEEKLSDHADSKSGVPLIDTMSNMTLDAMLQTTMSYTDNIQLAGESHPYVTACAKLSDIGLRRIVSVIGHTPLWKFTTDGKRWKQYCDFVRGMGTDIIQQRKQQLASDMSGVVSKKYQDLLDMLLKAKDGDGQGLTDEEILDEVTTFMFAGHDTTSSSLSWILYDLACHPEYQQMCRDEVDQVLEQHDEPHTTWEDTSKFPYLTQCIKEAMRLHTVVPFIQRWLKEDMVIDGCNVPAGTPISLGIYQLHHNPQIWEDSMVYNPDRFSPANVAKMDPFAFIPFSAGSRFEVSIPSGQELETEVGIVTKPRKHILLNVTKRTDKLT